MLLALAHVQWGASCCCRQADQASSACQHSSMMHFEIMYSNLIVSACCRVVPVASIPPAAGGLPQLQRPSSAIEGVSLSQIYLKQRPILGGVPEVEAVSWNKQTEVRIGNSSTIQH
jgi:hypothetical protein